jgi:hypothetical protein
MSRFVFSNSLLELLKSRFLDFVRQEGWLAGNEGVEVPGVPCERVIESKGGSGDLRISETVRCSLYESAGVGSMVHVQGTIAVFFMPGNRRIWFLKYSYHCREGELPFLKRILSFVYSSRLFNENCAQSRDEDAGYGLAYINRPDANWITAFHGTGTIIDIHDDKHHRRVGHGLYNGRAIFAR